MTDAIAELTELVREREEAVRTRDAELMIGRLSPELLNFPLLPPAIQHGRQGTVDALDAWFGGYREGPGYEVRALRVEADGDNGYCAFSYHVTGVLQSGDVVDMWVRATLVCRRVEGRWQVVHAHESVPFDAATGKALISEAPDA
jgi:ketosteroid isomerase-like protein